MVVVAHSFTLAIVALSALGSDGFSTPASKRDLAQTLATPTLSNSIGVGRCVISTRHSSCNSDALPATRAATAIFQSTTAAEVKGAAVRSDATPLVDAVVCGGGPAGLLSAIMLAKTFNYKVKVFERLPPPPEPTDESVWSDIAKFYLIGLGERGQAALREFGVWDDVKACCTSVPGRMDWAPNAGPDEGVVNIFKDRPITTEVLPRDKLVGVLHQHILKNYQGMIEMEYQKEVTPVDFDNDDASSVLIQVSECATEFLRDTPSNVGIQNLAEESLCDVDNLEYLATKLLVGSDGTQRTIATEMEKADKVKRDSMSFLEKLRYGPSFRIKRYADDNQRIYKTIPIKVPSKWQNDLNYSARSKDGRILYDSLPADANGNQCAALLLKREDELAQENSDPKKLREVFDEVLPQFSALLDDDMIEQVAKKPPSFLPSFRYAMPRLNQGDRTVVLGDAIHTVKPYFGLGANSALEDVQILKRSIEGTTSMKEATHLFSKERAGESKALVEISRELDRPGLLGVFTFIMPLVVDSIFNKLAPKIFSPNTIAMLQKRENSFRGIRRRKRMERVGQIATLGAFFTAMKMGAQQLILVLSRLTGKRNTTVTATLAASLAAVVMAKKVAPFLVPGMAPADVLTKAPKSKEKEEEIPVRTITAYSNNDEDIASNMSGGGI